MRHYKSWANYLPGISIIRTHVINPLLVATEKVVEQYIPETRPANATQDTPEVFLSTGQSQ